MRRADPPRGPIRVYDTAPGWDEWRPRRTRRRVSVAITVGLAVVTLAALAATLGPIIASHL